MKHTAYAGTNCIVTGGAGFIGQNLVRALLENGANVYVIDNLSYGAVREDIPEGAVFVQADVRDPHAFDTLAKKQFDYLFHLAAPSSNVIFLDELSESIDVTVTGFLNTIRFAEKNKIRYVYPSTGSLYNGVKPPHTEKAVLNPDVQNEYAKTKIALEYLASIYEDKVNAIGLRILAGYGPGELHKGKFQGVVYGFCRQMYEGNAPEIWGDGEQRRDFVYIKDIVNVMLTLAVDCPERIINIGTGSDISFNELIDLINSKLDSPVKPIYKSKPTVYLERTTADTTLLRKYYKQPFTPIEQGVQDVLDSFNNS